MFPFQITTFFEIGFRFSYIEISSLCIATITLIKIISSQKFKIQINPYGLILIAFIFFSISSAIFAEFLRYFGFLEPISTGPFFIDSLTGVGKLFFFLVTLTLVAENIPRKSNNLIWIGLALSNIIPTLVLYYQQYNWFSPLSLYFNGFSGYEHGWIIFDGYRPMSLTQELTFYSYYTLFSIIASFHIISEKVLPIKISYIILSINCAGVLLASSRSAMLIMAVMIIFFTFKKSYNFQEYAAKKIFFILVFLYALYGVYETQGLTNAYSNPIDRLSSLATLTSGNFDVDGSVFARMTNLTTLLNYAFENTVFTGVGIFNYNYYLNLPEGGGNSHSFIVQLMVEFGIIPLFVFGLYTLHISINRFPSKYQKVLLLNVIFYSLSGIPLAAPLTYVLLLFKRNGPVNK